MAIDREKVPGDPAEERRRRLAEELRANLQRRKAQARARRSGESDGRPEGLPAAARPAAEGDG
ncbi:hypothetical protein ACLB6G_14415 [Zhengella sp. ZM62]|uniref:hypothetical protein n=1 Tax=Zhengella sedimenti TaxID=3390035 RepID=UPI0039756AA6